MRLMQAMAGHAAIAMAAAGAAARLEIEVVERRAAERRLTEALERVETLRGLLPACSWCTRIRDDSSRWRTIEDYVCHKTEARFTHGICPDCMAVHFSGLNPGTIRPPGGDAPRPSGPGAG